MPTKEDQRGVTLAGERPHALVLLPGERDDINWKDACAWAAEIGGELPSRIDQLVLLQNVKSEFQDAYYWSGQGHASEPRYAWYQGFLTGYQSYTSVDYALRARAVRRVPIQ